MIENIADFHSTGDNDTPQFNVENCLSDDSYAALYKALEAALIYAVDAFEVFEVTDTEPPVNTPEEFANVLETMREQTRLDYPDAEDKVTRDLALIGVGTALGESLIPVFMMSSVSKDSLVETIKGFHGDHIDEAWVNEHLEGIAQRLDKCSEILAAAH